MTEELHDQPELVRWPPCPRCADSARQLAKVTARAEQAEQERDAAWQHIERAWDIEPRAYFEKEAPSNGFKWPLVQAIHHIWKRDAKVAAIRDALEQLKAKWEREAKDLTDCNPVSFYAHSMARKECIDELRGLLTAPQEPVKETP